MIQKPKKIALKIYLFILLYYGSGSQPVAPSQNKQGIMGSHCHSDQDITEFLFLIGIPNGIPLSNKDCNLTKQRDFKDQSPRCLIGHAFSL